MTRPGVLLLVHRIPYPPNKGDKIRSYHLLRFLSQRYDVHLGTFVDDEADWGGVEPLRELCADVCAVPLHPRRRRLLSLTALLTDEPLSVPYYRNRTLAVWVRRKIYDEGVRRFLAFSSPMAQYAPANGVEVRKIVDFVDVDSEKWRQYAERHDWPLSWIYRREGRRLLEFEERVAASSSASVFVTREEADLFRRKIRADRASIRFVINGVDTEYFDPGSEYDDPYSVEGPVVVFTGAMDYWANVDAVRWFALEIFPRVLEAVPQARFVIVGAKPTPEVKRLSRPGQILVTGAVPDIRPYLAHACTAVAPMRVARGIQNKILEAMAMARPVVGTSAGFEGLAVPGVLRRNVVDGPAELAARVVELLRSEDETGASGREWVSRHHDWSTTLGPIEQILEQDVT